MNADRTRTILVTEPHGKHGITSKNISATEPHGNTRNQEHKHCGLKITRKIQTDERSEMNFFYLLIISPFIASVCFRVFPWLIGFELLYHWRSHENDIS